MAVIILSKNIGFNACPMLSINNNFPLGTVSATVTACGGGKTGSSLPCITKVGTKSHFDESYWQQLIETAMQREESNPDAKNLKFANQSNHSKAQMATNEPNLNTLKLILVPTLVIHGSEDPIFPPPHAVAVAETVPDGKLLLIDNMGHALNPIFFEKIITAIVSHTNI